MGTTGQLPISINIFSTNVVVKYVPIYIVNYRIGYYLDVKLADPIGCDIDLTGGTKSKNR